MYTLGDKVFFEGNFRKTSCIPFFWGGGFGACV